MRIVDIIEKKRDGNSLTEEEINFFVEGYTKGDVPDYQASALAMAIYFQDMDEREKAAITKAMMYSGDTIDLSEIEGIKVDKHSTGGVGDTTTLILAPLVASVGVPVAKMSGRGLGHTGGTVDKMEAVPGFHVEIEKQQFVDLVNNNGLAVMGQSENLTPADKKLYSLRDVTGTVNSIPLIASSIMSKKLAAGADSIVLDVKTGSGAFMKSLEDSKALAEAMVHIGKELGRQTTAVISDMNQPLGYMVGNALEVKEAAYTLRGDGPTDLTELCLTLGSHMVVLAEKAKTTDEARKMLEDAIKSGAAMEKFEQFLDAQGGDSSVIRDLNRLPVAEHTIEVTASKDGYVSEIVADEIGTAAMMLGAGRATKDSEIDLAVGIELKKKIGDAVKKGEPLAIMHANNKDINNVSERIIDAFKISSEAVESPTLVYDTFSS
ncbi:pyrimidine-nucleoside phosphorylase [Texcoconibacillus texcoconensis]|uniref:Pyrimidine-nucleoside phosphorylase n=1 Tax=Texcoconibacillus texcoconensis TaxID=1095777 RepID=A0A840QNM2_9BACI|nr:pyrimidine-nucleoside phosphorylase [Texcoconibacillus texcoconensis]MBB5172986.1 pyrimidine-nucleoside phosphorylase [Texcoconibacillus texcoconensis]